ncbi:MAG: ComEA family DNA-binding protein [Polyangiaceae bacterium]
MKPLLQRDRATNAVPARSLALARLGAWARESLVARGIAVLLGLGVLAMIGGSALAGNGSAAKPVSSAAPPQAPQGPSSPRAVEPVDAIDAGAIPLTRPELLPVASPDRPASAAGPVTRATPDDPVDLNTARVEDLRRLPGVGAKRAEAILTVRARLPGGRFKQLEDLLKVKGIGRAMLRRLHPLVRIS